jgi:soluble lytic murein transglycosylase-like protein
MKWITILSILISNVCFAPVLPKDHYDQNSKYTKLLFRINLPQEILTISGIEIPPKANLNHIELLYQRADSLNIPKRILFRLVYQESRYNPYIISPKLAFSYMQIIPDTFNKLKIKYDYEGYHTPEINIIFGTQLIKNLYDYWQPKCNSEEQTWKYVLASYNAGKYWVIHYKGIPPFEETKNFVKFILS